jgi:hypothetical protein
MGDATAVSFQESYVRFVEDCALAFGREEVLSLFGIHGLTSVAITFRP